MKKLLFLSISCLFGLATLYGQAEIHIKGDGDPSGRRIAPNERIEIEGSASATVSLFKTAGHDGGRLVIKDSMGILQLSESKEAPQLHQSEMLIRNAGKMVLQNDSNGLLHIRVQPLYPDFYWLLFRKGGKDNVLPDSVFGPIDIYLKTSDMEEKPASFVMGKYSSGGNLYLYCLPQEVPFKALWKGNHAAEDVAHFALSYLRDRGGNQYAFGPGDYVLTNVRSWRYKQ